jgi:hypothetical protein
VPRIRDQYTDIAVYIYGSLADAKNGESFGGSGFLVFVPHETNEDHLSPYAVTNAHVVRKSGAGGRLHDCSRCSRLPQRPGESQPKCLHSEFPRT